MVILVLERGVSLSRD